MAPDSVYTMEDASRVGAAGGCCVWVIILFIGLFLSNLFNNFGIAALFFIIGGILAVLINIKELQKWKGGLK